MLKNKARPEETYRGSISLYMKLMTFSRPYRLHVVIIGVLIVFDVLYGVVQVWMQKQMIETIHLGRMEKLREYLILFVGVYFLFAIFALLHQYIRFNYQQKVVKGMIESVFQKINRLSLSKVREKHTSDWMTRLKRDVRLASGITGRLSQNLLYQLAMVVVAFSYISNLNLKYAIWLLVLAPLPFLAGRLFDKKTRAYSKEISRKNAEVRGILQETLHGIQDIKLFGMGEIVSSKYEGKLRELNKISMKRSLFVTTAGQTLHLLTEAIRLIVFISMVWLSIKQSLSVGVVLAFMLLINRLQGPFNSSSRLIGSVQEGLASADRLVDVWELEEEERVTSKTTAAADDDEYAIRIRNLRFAYQEDERSEPLFRQLTLDIRKGEFAAIVGPSGSGKSTLARLCCGLYEPTAGEIRVNGRPVGEALQQIRSEIAYIPQEPFLFTGTVYENIVLDAGNTTELEVCEAAELANLTDDIRAWPLGFQEPVKELGKNMSGGQRQKIAIARACLQKAELYIMDEITSALDVQSEQAVMPAIERLAEGKTAILITHRLASLPPATRIIVMAKGEIVEQGTHQELMDREGMYYSMYMSQLLAPRSKPFAASLL